MSYREIALFQVSKDYSLPILSVVASSLLLTGHASLQHIERKQWLARGEIPYRIAHARELLGTSYEKSVVKLAEGERSLRAFIAAEVNQRLPEAYRSQSNAVAQVILSESARHQLDPLFTMAVISHESRFKPDARGSFGEIGLMQVKPDTAAWIASRSKLERFAKTKNGARAMLFDPVQNIRVGTAYFAHLRKRFASHGRMYLSAYNMGTVRLLRKVRSGAGPLPSIYASTVMREYVKLYSKLLVTSEKLALN